MDNKEKIEFNLDNYIENSYDKFACLIDGNWGCGKTFLVNNYIKNSKNKNEIVYISLNGATDLNKTFRNAIVNNSLLENGKKFAKGFIKNVIKEKFGIEIDDLDLPSISIFNIYEGLNKRIIFIDDIERCKCDIDEIFGLIDEFLRNDFKIILIMNSEAFKDNKYKEIQEKIINQKINIKPDKTTLEDIINTIPSFDNDTKIDIELFKQTITKNYPNWFYVLEQINEKEKYKIAHKPNLRLLTRLINNSLFIIKVLEEHKVIKNENKEQIYEKIINSIYLHLHKETFPNEIDECKYEDCKKEYLDSIVKKMRTQAELEKDKYEEIEFNYKEYCENANKTTVKRLEYANANLKCIDDYFLDNEMNDFILYKKEFDDMENIPDELNYFKNGNVFEEDYKKRSQKILDNINNYKPIYILRIIEKLLETDYYLNTNITDKNKKLIKNFIIQNKTIIIDTNPIDYMRIDYNEKLNNVRSELFNVINDNNATIYFNRLENRLKNLADFSKDEEIIINDKVFQKFIKMPHKKIIKKAIEQKQYQNYIDIVDWIFKMKAVDDSKKNALINYKENLLKTKISEDKIVQRTFENWLRELTN